MTLERRLAKLEAQAVGDPNVPDAIAVDVPGSPDLALTAGEWQPVPDGRRMLAEHRDAPVKVYVGFDPQGNLSMGIKQRLDRLERSYPADGRPTIRSLEIHVTRRPGDPPAGRYAEPGGPEGGLPIFRVYHDAPDDRDGKDREP